MEGPGVEAETLLNSLKIRLSPTISVERQFDNKLGIVEMTGKQGKYSFSRTKAAKLFQLVCTSPLVEGSGVKAIGLLRSLENPTFAEGFGGEVV